MGREQQNIEEAKRKAKERMEESIDAYFDRFQAAKDGRLPSIDEIERMWGDGKRELEEILAEVTSGLSEPEGASGKKKLPKMQRDDEGD